MCYFILQTLQKLLESDSFMLKTNILILLILTIEPRSYGISPSEEFPCLLVVAHDHRPLKLQQYDLTLYRYPYRNLPTVLYESAGLLIMIQHL